MPRVVLAGLQHPSWLLYSQSWHLTMLLKWPRAPGLANWIRCLGPWFELLVEAWVLPVSFHMDSPIGHIATQGPKRHKSRSCQAFWRLRPGTSQYCFHSLLLVNASDRFSLDSMGRDMCFSSTDMWGSIMCKGERELFGAIIKHQLPYLP